MHHHLLLLGLLLVGSCRKTGELPPPAWSPVRHTWPTNPLVEVCHNAPVTHFEVQWALDVWAEHGAPHLQAVPSHCYSKLEDYTVYVDLPSPEEHAEHWTSQVIGLTGVYFAKGTRVPIAADVHLLTDDRRVLVHEIGHIWFPNHYPGQDHVMSEWLHGFEWDGWEGIERAFRRR